MAEIKHYTTVYCEALYCGTSIKGRAHTYLCQVVMHLHNVYELRFLHIIALQMVKQSVYVAEFMFDFYPRLPHIWL